MDQIFNELSANSSYLDKFAANAGMERMLTLSISLRNCGYSNALRVTERFCDLYIAPEYTIRNWGVDRTVGANRDLQRLLLTNATRTPYIENFILDVEDDCIFEFHFDQQSVQGLGLAHLWGSTVISLDGDARFTQSKITIQFRKLCNEKDTTELVSVSSISSNEQLEATCAALRASQMARISSGTELVNCLQQLFPYISFGQSALEQLISLKGSEQYFGELLRHFSILNESMENWSAGPFLPKGITWSKESESTLQQFGDLRTFLCTDGTSRLFSFHSKLISANQRVYFYPIPQDKRVHIGYVGTHLPTVKHRT